MLWRKMLKLPTTEDISTKIYFLQYGEGGLSETAFFYVLRRSTECRILYSIFCIVNVICNL